MRHRGIASLVSLAHGIRSLTLNIKRFHRVTSLRCRVRLYLRRHITYDLVSFLVASFTCRCNFGHGRLANGQFTELLIIKDWLVAQWRKLEAFFQRDLVWAYPVAYRANCATPDFIVLEFAMQLKQFAMVLEVIYLLSDVY